MQVSIYYPNLQTSFQPHSSPQRTFSYNEPRLDHSTYLTLHLTITVNTQYLNAGIRVQEKAINKFYCKISYEDKDHKKISYQVQGIFMPNKLTVDANANQRLDILRCPLRNPHGSITGGNEGQELYRLFGSKNTVGHVSVDIIRGVGNSSTTLVSFSIPWKTRRTGFLLLIPPIASQLDAWKGHVLDSNIPPSITTIDHLHVCVPATSQYPTKKVLPMFMEFISHNVLLGTYESL